MKNFYLVLFLSLGIITAKAQIITTFAGNGYGASTTGTVGGYSGDGGTATAAEFFVPDGVAVDAYGNVYISDRQNNRIRKVNTSGIISTVAGNGIMGHSGDGGPATAAEIYSPFNVKIDASGNMYIADRESYRIRKVNTSGIISTIAGDGGINFAGDGGPATAAQIKLPSSAITDASGNLYIADTYNNCIREVNTSGIINTIIGIGAVAGYSGDGGQATAAELDLPENVALDASGNIYISDFYYSYIRKVNTSGIISIIAGDGIGSYSGDGGPATAAKIWRPNDVEIDASGNIYISDQTNYRIRKVNTSGIISTVAGDGRAGYSGDGGQATAAEIDLSFELALDASGNLYIADQYNNVIREIHFSLNVSTGIIANESCNGGNNGSASATASYGTTPYTYSWSGGGTNSTYTGLTAGTYTITVTDSKSITGSATVSITQPATALSVSASTTANVSCNGGENGIATATVSGGISPYTYSWSSSSCLWSGGQATPNYTWLPAGAYTVTVTDSNGCTATAAATVTQPAILYDSIASDTNPCCYGASGSATIGVRGGTSPYNYYWAPTGQTTAHVSGLSAGSYTVQVTDAQDCEATTSLTLTQPAVLTISTALAAAQEQAMAYVNGGTPPYTYAWYPGGSTSSFATGISAGTYTVTVKDSNLCVDSALIDIPAPLLAPGLGLSLVSLPTDCGDDPPMANFAIMITSFPHTIFNSCVVDIYVPESTYNISSGYFYSGGNFQSATGNDYIPNMTILSDSVIEIQFGDSTLMSPQGTMLTDTAQVLLYFGFEVQGCEAAPISFTNTVVTSHEATYTDSVLVGSSYVYHDSDYHNIVYFPDTATAPACPVTIDPLDTINAGTNAQSIPHNSSILTIRGSGFGSTKGFIYVPDANSGSINNILLDNTDILSWSNNEIKVKMPSVMFGSQSAMTPGSGTIAVVNTCGDRGGQNLTINYNIENSVYPPRNEKLRNNIVMANTTESLLFRCDTSISNNSRAYADVQQAIATWNCYTGVNWKLGNDTILAKDTMDGISNIYFTNSLPPGYLMGTAVHIDTICNTLDDSMAIVYDADILISPTPAGHTWNYNVSDTAFSGNNYYFYDVLLHELGHAHMLGHVDDPTSLMWYQNHLTKRVNILSGVAPGPQTLYGGFDVVSTDSAFINSCTFLTLKNIPRGCKDTTLGISSIVKNEYNLNLYPNPASSNITIAYQLNANSYVQFKIIDYTGREVLILNNEDKSPGVYSEKVNINAFARGIYLLIANINGEIQTIKFIKI